MSTPDAPPFPAPTAGEADPTKISPHWSTSHINETYLFELRAECPGRVIYGEGGL